MTTAWRRKALRKRCVKKKMDPAPWVQRGSAPAEVRIADEVLTILAEAALEHYQIDRALTAMGTTQNLKEENVVVAPKKNGSKSTQAALGQAAREDEGKILRQPIDLECVLRHGEGNKNCRSLERVAHDV